MKKLNVDDATSASFRALGIVSSEKDYRLCFFFNKELIIDLEKSANLNVFEPLKKKRNVVFCFVHRDEDSQREYYFSKNRQDGFFLLPEMKQADFIFLEPVDQKNNLEELRKKILKIPAVQSCFLIPPQHLKNIDAE